MLDPRDRHLLADALRPPPGYRFDRAVSTTYTLDLLTLLTMPVAFTLYHWAASEGRDKIDPLALLEAVRRHAKRIHVFCQAGRIAVPRRSQLLYGYLENSVIEATAPNGGAFHPKVTVLRYAADPEAAIDEEDPPLPESVCYRMLCASRNLTFDRSWDTLLVLEGELDLHRVNAFSRNRPLSQFVGALPAMATRPVRDEARADIEQMADELLRVRFEEPKGFSDLAFLPIGLDDREVWPFGIDCTHFLVVSPFVDPTFLNWVTDDQEEFHLVSRVDALDGLPEEYVEDCDSCYTLSDSAETLEPQGEPDDEGSAEPDASAAQPQEEGVEVEPSEIPLRGLHTKLFVADIGWGAKIWTGSANATAAAFRRNVEFLVELTGRSWTHGVMALLGESQEGDGHDRGIEFRDLLVPYQRRGEVAIVDPIERLLEGLIDQARDAMVRAKLVAKVTSKCAEEDPLYALAVEATESPAALPDGVTLAIRPVSLRAEDAIALKDLSARPVATFESLSFEALTGFLAAEVTARREGQSQRASFVLNLPLLGAPADRESRLLLSLLSNPQRLLRYLMMLLADVDLDPRQLLEENETAGDGSSSDPRETSFGLPLLEPLLRALDRDPGRLKYIARLVDDLRATEKGQEILPKEFMAIWEPIWSVSKEQADAQA